jgi:hypothetical protein
MLTETEKKESERMLGKLSDEELTSLKDTITKKQIAAETRNGKLFIMCHLCSTSSKYPLSVWKQKTDRSFILRHVTDSDCQNDK